MKGNQDNFDCKYANNCRFLRKEAETMFFKVMLETFQILRLTEIMKGIDFIIKNNNEDNNNDNNESLSPKILSLLKSQFSEKEILTESESLINSYNTTLENIKMFNSLFLVYFEEQFKITGCPDLVLKSLWVIFCIAKNRFKKEQTSKMLIHFLFAKLNLFFSLEDSSKFFENYFNFHYSFLVDRNKNENLLFPQNQSEKYSNQVYYSNLEEKEFLDEIFSKVFKLNSVLDKESNDYYLDSVLTIPILNGNQNTEPLKEENFNISVFDTNEVTVERIDNRQQNKFIMDLSLNEEDNQTKNDITKQSFNEINEDLTRLNQSNHRRISPFKNLNISSSLINRLNEENDWSIENANLLLRRINVYSKNLKSSHKITDYDYPRILMILTKFYHKNFLDNNNQLDDLTVYDNINLDKFLQFNKKQSPVPNTNSSLNCLETLSDYFNIPKEKKIETPMQATNENSRYNQFIDSLSNYIYYDTHFLIKKYQLKYYFQNNNLEDFFYASIYENFYKNYLKKNAFLDKEIDKIKSSFDKNLFLKFIDDYISNIVFKNTHYTHQKEEEQNKQKDKEDKQYSQLIKKFCFSEFYKKVGFDLQFFENLFIIVYFIYLNLLLFGKPNIDELNYHYIKTLNSFKYLNYSLIFNLIENFNKMNYPNCIKNLLRSLSNLIVSLALLSKDSFLHKKAIHIKSKEKVENKLEEISKPINKEKDENALIIQEFKEKSLKVIVSRIYTYAAPKFNFFFKRWKIKQEYNESIWALFKVFITDYSDLLIDNCLDYYIVLTLFITIFYTEEKSDLFQNDLTATSNKYKQMVDKPSEFNPELLFKTLVNDYIEANRNDISNILKLLLLNSFPNESPTPKEKSEDREAIQNNSPNKTQSYNNSKRVKIPFQMLNEFKKCSDFIFSNTQYFIVNFKPKSSILYDDSLFIKHKNLFSYDMEIIYSYTPKIKAINSSSNDKNSENIKFIKTNKDQTLNSRESNKFKIDGKEIKSKNDVNPNSDKMNTKNTSYFNLINSGFFSNQTCKDHSNNSNISFLNTKRIQKITTPISTKIINSSPFKEKTLFLLNKNNSAFRNLKKEFGEK